MRRKKIIFVNSPERKKRTVIKPVDKKISEAARAIVPVQLESVEFAEPDAAVDTVSSEETESRIANEAANGACYDLWSTLSKIAELPAEVRAELFGSPEIDHLLNSFAWNEVVEIYNRFVESLLIGPYDIVENEGKTGLVLSKNNKSFSVLTASRAVQVWPTHQVKKVGHCDEFGTLLESCLNSSKES